MKDACKGKTGIHIVGVEGGRRKNKGGRKKGGCRGGKNRVYKCCEEGKRRMNNAVKGK